MIIWISLISKTIELTQRPKAIAKAYVFSIPIIKKKKMRNPVVFNIEIFFKIILSLQSIFLFSLSKGDKIHIITKDITDKMQKKQLTFSIGNIFIIFNRNRAIIMVTIEKKITF